ncbi:hypothetical protein TA3x_000090 [Tundrisphaera sp. TA3]|uniref:hypothetical protein n=1 Tax=Tundrisphaera sp. TA3 TaxID=3435775 RepID=UPI003EBD4D86
MNPRHYGYVGPEAIRLRVAASPPGQGIGSLRELNRWAAANKPSTSPAGQLVATFVVALDGRLCLADRHSEHIACSGGQPVLSAGEMFFEWTGRGVSVVEVSNQSTGFCPEPESWPAVAAALDRLGVDHPGEFTTQVIFRRCPSCGERNLVKDDVFECQICGAGLPCEWNFA